MHRSSWLVRLSPSRHWVTRRLEQSKHGAPSPRFLDRRLVLLVAFAGKVQRSAAVRSRSILESVADDVVWLLFGRGRGEPAVLP